MMKRHILTGILLFIGVLGALGQETASLDAVTGASRKVDSTEVAVRDSVSPKKGKRQGKFIIGVSYLLGGLHSYA